MLCFYIPKFFSLIQIRKKIFLVLDGTIFWRVWQFWCKIEERSGLLYFVFRVFYLIIFCPLPKKKTEINDKKKKTPKYFLFGKPVFRVTLIALICCYTKINRYHGFSQYAIYKMIVLIYI